MGEIVIKQGDITKEDVDVIVNAANTSLCGGGGVDGAIHSAAGSSVMDECMKIGRCATGNAVITNAGDLKAKKIIHTVGPVWRGGKNGEPDLLRSCYQKSLTLAYGHKLKGIAFPAISTGVYRYPKVASTKIALKEGFRFRDKFDEIRYICFSDADFKIYKDVFKEM